MKIIGNLIFIISLSALLISCEKPEGVGGESTIEGSVYVNVYDKEFRVLQDRYPAQDEDVYIIYGNDLIHSDETNSSSNGMFRFDYLTKGKYTVFVYSDDNTGTGLTNIVIDTTINLSSNKDEVDIGILNIYKGIDYDDGLATIHGKIRQITYSNNFIFPLDTIDAKETDVYLIYENQDYYIERTRTLHDGSFAFPNLLKGNYQVIVYSDNQLAPFDKIPVVEEVTIYEINQTVDVGVMQIVKED